ncbi:MAG: hypothetical protein ABR936_11900 [Bacteroidota bacterium]|jgi:uncharacterized protein (DUF697 family)
MEPGTDQTVSYNYGKSKQQITFDFIRWILGAALAAGIAYGTLESRSHAETTYVKKDLFEAFEKNNEQQHNDMKVLLKEIRDYQAFKKRN